MFITQLSLLIHVLKVVAIDLLALKAPYKNDQVQILDECQKKNQKPNEQN